MMDTQLHFLSMSPNADHDFPSFMMSARLVLRALAVDGSRDFFKLISHKSAVEVGVLDAHIEKWQERAFCSKVLKIAKCSLETKVVTPLQSLTHSADWKDKSLNIPDSICKAADALSILARHEEQERDVFIVAAEELELIMVLHQRKVPKIEMSTRLSVGATSKTRVCVTGQIKIIDSVFVFNGLHALGTIPNSSRVIPWCRQDITSKRLVHAHLLYEFPRGRTFVQNCKEAAESRQHARRWLTSWNSLVADATKLVESKMMISDPKVDDVVAVSNSVCNLDGRLRDARVDSQTWNACLQTKDDISGLLLIVRDGFVRCWVRVLQAQVESETALPELKVRPVNFLLPPPITN